MAHGSRIRSEGGSDPRPFLPYIYHAVRREGVNRTLALRFQTADPATGRLPVKPHQPPSGRDGEDCEMGSVPLSEDRYTPSGSRPGDPVTNRESLVEPGVIETPSAMRLLFVIRPFPLQGRRIALCRVFPRLAIWPIAGARTSATVRVRSDLHLLVFPRRQASWVIGLSQPQQPGG